MMGRSCRAVVHTSGNNEDKPFSKCEHTSRLVEGACWFYMPVMKVRDADIIIVPGFSGSGPDHWQSRWETKLSTARRMAHTDWKSRDSAHWDGSVAEAVNAATRPVVLVGHSLGVAAIEAALPDLRNRVAGAFLVARPDLSGSDAVPEKLRGFGAYRRSRLPFPAMLVASRNDPYSAFEFTDGLGQDWGALVLDAGEAGHINAEAGYGPWPEGSMAFANFLSKLS